MTATFCLNFSKFTRLHCP